MGARTPVRHFSGLEYLTEDEATGAACEAVPWLGPLLGR